MINLLPAEDREFIKKEHTRRLAVVIGFFLFSFVLIAVILLFPSYFLLVSQQKSFESQLGVIRQIISQESADKIEAAARDLNEQLAHFVSQEGNAYKISALIKEILDTKPSAIKITGFSYQKEKVKGESLSIYGKAETRDFLVSFIKDMENTKKFYKIESPPSNLLKGENIDFVLIISLTPPKAAPSAPAGTE